MSEYQVATFSLVRQLAKYGVLLPALAVDASGQNIYGVGDTTGNDVPNTISHVVEDGANGFTLRATISGALTGLSKPSSIAVGSP